MDGSKLPIVGKQDALSRVGMDEPGVKEEEIDLRAILDILKRRKWVILSILMASLALAMSYSIASTPIYRASVSIEIQPEQARSAELGKDAGSSEVSIIESEKYYNTQVSLLESQSFIEYLVDKYRLFNDPRMLSSLKLKEPKTKQELDIAKVKTVSYIKDNLDVKKDPRTRIIVVYFMSPDPNLSSYVANAIGETYIDWNIKRKIEGIKNTRRYYEGQLEQARIDLERAEDELQNFLRSANIVTFDEKLNDVYAQLAIVNESYARASAERAQKEALYEQLNKATPEQLVSMINDPLINNLFEKLASLKEKEALLASKYTPEYPELKQIRNQIEELERSIKDAANFRLQNARREYLQALDAERRLGARVAALKAQALNLNEQLVKYNVLKKRVETSREVYNSLLIKLKQAEAEEGIRIAPIQVVDKAKPPETPYKPNLKMNMAVGLVAGLFGGIFLAFLVELYDNRVKTKEDLERMGVPVLGVVPDLKELSLEKIREEIHDRPSSMFSEAVRLIRTSLVFALPGDGAKSLFITSTTPEEGKTTLSSSLAIAFALSGAKTVLVDADLRRPSVAKVFFNGKPVGFGLTHYLAGRAKGVEDIINKTDFENLHIIASGPLPPNPVELLHSEKMNELLQRLKQEYEVILIDGPPAMGFADAYIVSSYADGTILVVSEGKAKKEELKHSLRTLSLTKGRVIGAILNMSKLGRSRYGYYYYYGYGKPKGELKAG
ncbi:MAG: polysaccharide biosynthesis tyrosine autokinase [Aquificaceae bacterium]|nr:polysaccharide biosynthesis tyrosine autokinase [Aquificaceae bacterium]